MFRRTRKNWSTLHDDVISWKFLSNKLKSTKNDRRLISLGMSINDRVIFHSFIMIPYLYNLKASIKCLNKQHWCLKQVTNHRLKSINKYVHSNKYVDEEEYSDRRMSPKTICLLFQKCWWRKGGKIPVLVENRMDIDQKIWIEVETFRHRTMSPVLLRCRYEF